MKVLLTIVALVIIEVVFWGLETLFGFNDKSDNASDSVDSNHNTSMGLGRIKCQCLSCKKIVYIPEKYLERRYGIQNAKCPNCGWKMRKVKIIQRGMER